MGKNKQENYSTSEGGKKVNAKEAKRQQIRRIQWIFKDADEFDGKFNRTWRRKMGYHCAGLPFSTLLTAFHKRYGDGITSNSSPGVAKGGDVPDNNKQDYHSNLDHDDASEEILWGLFWQRVCKAWNTVIVFVTQGCQGIAFVSSALFRIPLTWNRWRWNYTKRYQQNQIAGGDFLDKNNQDLPPSLNSDTVDEILRRLNLPLLMRAKTVCKDWNTAISATNVSLHNVEETNLFVMQQMVQGFQGIALFSSAFNRWFRIPLLPWKTWSWYYTKRYHPRPTQLYLCAAAAGLYLFLDWDDFSYRNSPVIINPITKHRRDLPPLPLHYGWTAGAAVEFIAQSGHFQVITLGFEESRPRDLCTLHYDSTTDKWTDVPATPAVPVRLRIRISSFFEKHRWTSAVHNGIVYFTNNYGHHLGCYDISGGEFQFREIEGGLPRKMNSDDYAKNKHASLPSLVVCSGKLLLVGRLLKKAGERSILGRFPFIKHTLVGIWELKNNNRWSLISVTPEDLLEDTVKSSDGSDFMVAAASGKIWLTIKGSLNMMCLDLRSIEWSVLPGCLAEDLVDCFPRRAVCGILSIHDKLSLFS
ncbi:hypothetical protein SUGI_1006610 [Cryptomeria japonica]|nr:hypothetical protein SUGI_1006610 [Cryptomeria japonica]